MEPVIVPGVGDDLLGRDADVDPAGCGDIAEAGDNPASLLPQAQQGAVNFLAVAHGAARAVDAQQQGGAFALLHLVDGLEHPGAGGAGDGALDGDARQGATGLATPGPGHWVAVKWLDLKKNAPTGHQAPCPRPCDGP